MSDSRQTLASRTGVPRLAIAALAAIFVAGLFLVAFDQGHTLSLIYGDTAYSDRIIHEFSHDIRHAAGFPCH